MKLRSFFLKTWFFVLAFFDTPILLIYLGDKINLHQVDENLPRKSSGKLAIYSTVTEGIKGLSQKFLRVKGTMSL